MYKYAQAYIWNGVLHFVFMYTRRATSEPGSAENRNPELILKHQNIPTKQKHLEPRNDTWVEHDWCGMHLNWAETITWVASKFALHKCRILVQIMIVLYKCVWRKSFCQNFCPVKRVGVGDTKSKRGGRREAPLPKWEIKGKWVRCFFPTTIQDRLTPMTSHHTGPSNISNARHMFTKCFFMFGFFQRRVSDVVGWRNFQGGLVWSYFMHQPKVYPARDNLWPLCGNTWEKKSTGLTQQNLLLAVVPLRAGGQMSL